MLGITFGTKHSYNDWGLWLEDTKITPPAPKRYLVDVPARNGVLDLTAELTPTVRYQARQLTFKFRIKSGDWNTTISQIYGDVHGKTLDVTSDLDPNWHWHGCVMVNDFASDRRTGVLVIIVDAEPFKLSNTQNQYTVNGNGTATAVVDRMEVSPAFEITAPTSITCGGASYTITSRKTKMASASGAIVSVGDGTANLANSLLLNINAFQEGSNDPSPTNIRPITGFSSTALFVRGRNLVSPNLTNRNSEGIQFDVQSDGGFHIYGTNPSFLGLYYLNESYNNLNLLPSQTYKLGFTGGDGVIQIQIYVNGTYRTNTTGSEITYTVPADAKTSFYRFRIATGSTVDSVVYPYCYLSSATAPSFEKSTGLTQNITWQSQAGTVYGGTLDVTSGTLTVTHLGKVFDGSASENWTRIGSSSPYLFRYEDTRAVTKLLQSEVSRMCSHFLNNTVTTTSQTTDAYAVYTPEGVNSTYVQIKPATTIATTVDGWKTWLAGQYENETPVTCVWEILNPIVYNLTPIQVRMLLGWNNIWTNCGGVAVTYTAQDYSNQKFFLTNLELPQGNNAIQVQSTGTTKITYTNGRL